MAASPSPGSRSPLRLGGIALLGVGVIAALAGLITTTQSGSTSTVAQAPTSSSAVLDPTGQAAAAPAPEPAIASPAPDAGTAAPNATPFVTGETGDGTAVGAAPPAAPEPAPAQPAAPPPAVAAPARPRPGRRRLRRGAGTAAHLQQQQDPGSGRACRRRLPRGRLDRRRDRRLSRRGHPDEHRLLPPRDGRAGRRSGDRPRLRPAGRTAVLRHPVGHPRRDRHRDEGVPVARQVVTRHGLRAA